MIKQLPLLFFLMCALFANPAKAKMEYDAKRNEAELYGPYVKYNFLKPPYSFGRYIIKKNDVRLDIRKPHGGLADQTGDQRALVAMWPRFLIDSGRVKIYTTDSRVIADEAFAEKDIGPDEKFAEYSFKDKAVTFLPYLEKGFFICASSRTQVSVIEICSDQLILEKGAFQEMEKSKAVKTLLNGKKVPKNAQISLEPGTQMELLVEFKSGFKIFVRDIVKSLKIEDLAIDPREKRIGVLGAPGKVKEVAVTLKDKFFDFLKEKNYFKKQLEGTSQWPTSLTDAEMEFNPFPETHEIQLFGLVLKNLPPSDYSFDVDKNSKAATYNYVVDLPGTKAKDDVLVADKGGELYIGNDGTTFLWKFPAPIKGTMNTSHLGLKRKDKVHYFSRRIFRAHRGSISAQAALTTSVTLSLVPGYLFSGDYWFENPFGNWKWTEQRVGISATAYETLQPFRINEDTNRYPDRFSIFTGNFDLHYRLSPGVRPVQRSFGASLRVLNYSLFRSISTDMNPLFIGIGGFWHTAPQKIIDDIFNIVPIFRYPKWMEISAYFYPMVLGDYSLGFSFSWTARGRMFFAKDWYLDASLNINSIQFAQRFDKFTVSTAHGSIGLGYLF
ncbi:MAG: hypothetical protein KDD33_02085 [Bdellovibrionales bacterium]|nr:hypothetical protein [Bdellovibrionales bacterium]